MRDGEGEGGMDWERNTAMCPLAYVKQTAKGRLLFGTETSACCSVMTWRGGAGEWDGRLKREETYVYTWLINTGIQQKLVFLTLKNNYTPTKKDW